jgi:lipopolysaccharide/colanic/teichoic acid biosynthesis glycosyltransferase
VAVIPIFIDSRPAYLGGGSLLLLPAGPGPLLRELADRAGAVTQHAPFVLTSSEVDERYEQDLRDALPGVGGLLGPEIFLDPLARFEPADHLLFVDAGSYPVDGLDLGQLVRAGAGDARMVLHLLAFEASSHGTKELVDAGPDGRVRRIQRYYEQVTWPFPTGVVATLAPVACLAGAVDESTVTLTALRSALAAHGMAGQDIPYRGGLCDLSDEAGALTFVERRLHDLLRHGGGDGDDVRGDGVIVAAGAVVDESARLVGPVYVADRGVVEAGALVVGPTVLGPGARVSRDATVAQCLLVSGAVAGARTTVRHRVVLPVGRHLGERPQRRHVGPGAPPPEGARRASDQLWYPRVKAVVEPIVALVMLLLLLPLMLPIAVLVALTSPGPIFYGHPREGKDGRLFRCLKFRSMRPDADALQRALAAQQQMDGPQFKMDNDPRVTRVGWWLRRLNLDELPQLINVVRGEMSLVGPRPSPFRENQICVPWRNARLSVRPGITGLWQICRHDRAEGDFHQWIHYDLLYVRHMSARVDLKILLYTVLTGGGRKSVKSEVILGKQSEPHAAAAKPAGGQPPLSEQAWA